MKSKNLAEFFYCLSALALAILTGFGLAMLLGV